MTCQACRRAQSDPTRDDFENHCMSCEARALAVTGGSMVREDAVQRLFGDKREEGLRLVGEWLGRIKRAKR